MKFFNARRTAYHTNPKQIDEVIYTPYVYDPPSNTHDYQTSYTTTGDLLGIPELREDGGSDEEAAVRKKRVSKFDTTATEAEIFLFEYGTVVIWGMTEAQEKRFLSSLYVQGHEINRNLLTILENGLRMKNWVNNPTFLKRLVLTVPQLPKM